MRPMKRWVTLPIVSFGMALGVAAAIGPVTASAGTGGAPGVVIGPQGARYPDGTAKVSSPESPAAIAQAGDKAALRDLYFAMVSGKAKASVYQTAQLQFIARWGIALQPGASRSLTPSMPGCPILPTLVMGIPTCSTNPQSGSVSLAQVPEQYCSWLGLYCYCGPATAYSMLNGLGYPRSHDGEALSQNELAINKYLETNYWGGTPWSGLSGDHPMPETLNYWRTGSYSGYYEADGLGQPNPAPSLSTFEFDLKFDVDNRWSLAANTHEKAGGTHLAGHPASAEIWHWLPLYGFQSYGSTTMYADPATSVWPPGVPAYSTTASSTMDSLIQDRGLVW
jgi:hypothetical protein